MFDIFRVGQNVDLPLGLGVAPRVPGLEMVATRRLGEARRAPGLEMVAKRGLGVARREPGLEMVAPRSYSKDDNQVSYF